MIDPILDDAISLILMGGFATIFNLIFQIETTIATATIFAGGLLILKYLVRNILKVEESTVVKKEPLPQLDYFNPPA
jgi:hypothetical protein